MTGTLSTAEIAQYHETGQVGPVPALSSLEVNYFRSALEAAEATLGTTLTNAPGQIRAKTHLLYPWMAELVRHPAILDAVESLIGPNLLVYHLTCWLKEPGDGQFVSWHQDGTYFGLEPFEHVTAWVALSDATRETGCIRFLPGSHKSGQRDHILGETKGNLLSNGQRVDLKVPEERAIDIVVPKGEVSFHHTHLIHASRPNEGTERRLGIGISYIPPHVRFVGEGRVTASLVRGTDEHGYFDHEPPPANALDTAARAVHADACQRFFASHGSARTAEI